MHGEKKETRQFGNLLEQNTNSNNMAIDKKRFWENLKGTLKNLGQSAGKVMENLEKQDKEMNERMKKVLESAK